MSMIIAVTIVFAALILVAIRTRDGATIQNDGRVAPIRQTLRLRGGSIAICVSITPGQRNENN